MVGVVDSMVRWVVDPTSLKGGEDRLGAVLRIVDVCRRREWGLSVGRNEWGYGRATTSVVARVCWRWDWW